MSAITLTNQGFSATSINPSASHLTRRGRLARTLVVLSLSVLMASGFAMKAGAGSVENPGGPAHFVTVVVAPGESLGTLASALTDGGDVRALVNEIVTVNSLESVDVQAGVRLRIPVK